MVLAGLLTRFDGFTCDERPDGGIDVGTEVAA